MSSEDPVARRSFLKVAGAAGPTLQWMGLAASAASKAPSSKFTPLDLSAWFNTSSVEFGPREKAKQIGGPRGAKDGLIRMMNGPQTVLGIPLQLASDDVAKKSWIGLSTRPVRWGARSVEIPVGRKAGSVCLAQFCDWDRNEGGFDDLDHIEQVGQHLADAVLVYEDGAEKRFPIRRRYEVAAPSISFGHPCFCALSNHGFRPAKLTEALPNATLWGDLQKTTQRYQQHPSMIWIWPLENPEPDRIVKTLRLEAKAEDPLLVCGVTLFHGRHSPLRRERRKLFAIDLPSPTAAETDRWKVSVDLGMVIRTFPLSEFDAPTWLRDPGAGLGEKAKPPVKDRLFVEIAASPAATVTLTDSKSKTNYDFELSSMIPGQPLSATGGTLRVEVLERDRVWLRGRVVDSATQKPTPVRIAFRSKEGRYLPPEGHRTEVNAGWFQDYGADVKVGDSSYAYIDGKFQIELPAGEVYVEISKGFEYSAIRRKLSIAPTQESLELEIGKHTDLRSKGWVSADTHVHFLSGANALLEAEGEGLNLVNLLAAQWGDLYTNVADLSYGPLVTPDKETIIRMGTENRQHLLGHIGLLGAKGEPVFPMSADGPNEGYLGDPMWSTMAEWADQCRKNDGVTVGVHFPNPLGEMAADIALGKMDAVELYPRGDRPFASMAYNDWYRYLNCGYKLAAAGGTDKMSASSILGGNRTYAWLGQDEYTFENWAKAVRKGRTFATAGPLLLFQADGRIPGDEVPLKKGGGSVEVQAEAISHFPIHRVEVVFNGKVVASREDQGGSQKLVLHEKVNVPGSGWLAVRCSSKNGRTTGWSYGIAAHTSPVYYKVAGEDVFSAPTISYMLALVDGAQAYVEQLATRPDQKRLAGILKVFTDAREHLHQRLHQHGIRHS